VNVQEPDAEFDAFCVKEHRLLVKTLTVYTADPELAVELAQETLARAYRDWRRVAAMDAPGAWAHRVALNLANSHLRRRQAERRAMARAAARLAASATATDVSDSTGVLRAAARLPRRQREALALRFLLDLSIDETADRMGCAAGTVRALTAQATARLRATPELARLLETSDG
jgi:RNA polymerase sigma factor (sigma-70 family)